MNKNKKTTTSELAQIYILSCISSTVAETVTFPLDIIKTRLQAQKLSVSTNKSSYPGSNLMQILKEISSRKHGGGPHMFWAGLSPACYRHLIYSGLRLVTYEYIREKILQREKDGSFPLHKAVIAGMFAGGFAQFLSNPFDLIKIKMQMKLKHQEIPGARSPSFFQVFREIISENKGKVISGLWRGWGPNSMRASLVQMGDLTTYDTAKQYFLGKGYEDNYITHGLASGCAGVVAAIIGTPADVVKTRLMIDNSPYRNAYHCLTSIIKEEGVITLWRGTLLNWMRMAPWSLTFYLTFEESRKLIGMRGF